MNTDQQLHESNVTSGSLEETARDARAQQLQSSRLRIALFKNLQVESSEERQAALEKIIQVAKSYVRVVIRSPYSTTSSEVPTTPTTQQHHHHVSSSSPSSPQQQHHHHCSNFNDTSDSETDHASITHDLSYDPSSDNEESNLRYYLLTMLRLAYTCPFSDVRQAFKEFLQMTNDSRLSAPQPSQLSPSIFISLNDIFSLDSCSALPSTSTFYPRPEHYSISPWSQEIDSSGDDASASGASATIQQLPKDVETGGKRSDEYVRQMMTKTFMEEGRLANVFRVMAFFPTFYEIYSSTYTKVLKSSLGPLSRSWKCYLAILASAHHQCQYLVSMMRLEYLQNGGDPAWLQGIEYAQPKLQHIERLILKMSRQSWQLTLEDMTGLMSRPGALVADVWSKGELVQGMVIISTFLGLSSFVLSCGIAPELDMRGGYYYHREDPSSAANHSGVEYELDERSPWSPGGKVQADMARAAASMATGWYDSNILLSDGANDDPFSSDNGYGLGVSVDNQEDEDDEEDDEEQEHKNNQDMYNTQTEELVSKLKSANGSSLKSELLESLEKLRLGHEHEQLAAKYDTTNHDVDNNNTSNKQSMNAVYEDLTRFIDPKERIHCNTEEEEEEMDTSEYHVNEVMSGDYCWEDFGCDVVNQFLPGLGDELDDEFNEALSITDWSIFHHTSDSNIDTSPLRRAIWYEAQRVLGMTKDDYNYEDITTYLSERNKQYIRKLCLCPSSTRLSDWNNIGLALRPEEKCHVNLLVASAKKQALLSYGLAVVTQV
ncbi:PA26-domain-containing protein [Lichtheimia hyalospora FSU 10163]|nr:PA26-domain-containing protein [Lichtheimia hyalospora FSU 10163]